MVLVVVVDARRLCALPGRHVWISIVPAQTSWGGPLRLPRTQETNRGLEPRARHPSLVASNNNNHAASISKMQTTGNQRATAEE